MAFCDFCRRANSGPLAVAMYRVRVYKHRSWIRRLFGIRPQAEVLHACSMHRMDHAAGETQDLAPNTRDNIRHAWKEWS